MQKITNNTDYYKARNMYVCGEKITSIAENLGVTEHTIQNWRRKAKKNFEDDWDHFRAIASSGSIEGVALNIYADFMLLLKKLREKLNDDDVTVTQIRDIYTAYEVMTRSTRKTSSFFDKKMFSIELFNAQEKFINDYYPDFSEKTAEIREHFAKYLIETGFFNKK